MMLIAKSLLSSNSKKSEKLETGKLDTVCLAGRSKLYFG